MAKQWTTTEDFIQNGKLPNGVAAGLPVRFAGYAGVGDGGLPIAVTTGNVIAPSQSPADLGENKLSDARGNELEFTLNSIMEFTTLADLEASELSCVNQRVKCRETYDAEYIIQPAIYVPLAGDIPLASGLVARLQIQSQVILPQVTTGRGASAIADAISRAQTELIGTVDLASLDYTFGDGETVNLTGVSGLRLQGCGATITAPTSGVLANIIYGGSVDDIYICGITFKGGTNKAISMQDPANVTVSGCNFYGQGEAAILMFTSDRGASGIAKNNHIINCFHDGQGVSKLGFGMEAMISSSIVNPIVTGVTIPSPGYAVNLKNKCIDTHIYNYMAYGNSHGLVFSDDGSGGVGSGCESCTAEGASRNNDLSGVSLNKTRGCVVNATIDQEGNDNGTDPAAHAGLAIQGLCEQDVINVTIRNIAPAQKAINVRSSDETIYINRYDLSSTNMLSLDATTNRIRTVLQDYNSVSGSFNPQDYIDDQGSSNEFTNMRRFRNDLLVLDVATEPLSNYQLSARLDQVTTRCAGMNVLTVDTNLSSIGPSGGQDNVFSAAGSDRRYTEVYAANGTINTSDERQKTELLPISDLERACALEIKSNISKFKMLDSVDRKGFDNARFHFGVGAQTVASIFNKHGLDPYKYSLFCYDEWEETQEIIEQDENGNPFVSQPYVPPGSAFGIRYDQLSMFILASI